MPRSLTYDVVIVGAGPAGLTAAYHIAKAGFRVAVLEMRSDDEFGYKVCGDAMSVKYFDEVGIPHPRMGIEVVGLFKGVRVYAPNETMYVDVYGEGYALDRKALAWYLRRLCEEKGVEFYTSHRFHAPVVEGTWVKGVKALGPGGDVKVFNTKIVIDASGTTSVVRRSLPREWWVSEPIPLEDYNATYREIWEGDIDVEHDLAYIFLNADIARGGYWWLFPKKRGVYNVGLGVQAGKGLNPLHQFERYIKPRFKDRISRILDRGGGLVPTRRPIPCMVWNGLVVVGDAACMANPIHGGGIGPAMLGGKIAAETIVEALINGRTDMESLWLYHIRYHRAYGAKQASLDILRMFLQTMSNEGLNFVFESKLVSGSEVGDIGSKGDIPSSVFSKLSSIARLIRKPKFLLKLYTVKKYMDKARELYENYPQSPRDYEKWRETERKLFEEYRQWLSKEA